MSIFTSKLQNCLFLNPLLVYQSIAKIPYARNTMYQCASVAPQERQQVYSQRNKSPPHLLFLNTQSQYRF